MELSNMHWLIFSSFWYVSSAKDYKKLLCRQIFLKIQKYSINRLNYFIRYFFYVALLNLGVIMYSILLYLALKLLLISECTCIFSSIHLTIRHVTCWLFAKGLRYRCAQVVLIACEKVLIYFCAQDLLNIPAST